MFKLPAQDTFGRGHEHLRSHHAIWTLDVLTQLTFGGGYICQFPHQSGFSTTHASSQNSVSLRRVFRYGQRPKIHYYIHCIFLNGRLQLDWVLVQTNYRSLDSIKNLLILLLFWHHYFIKVLEIKVVESNDTKTLAEIHL